MLLFVYANSRSLFTEFADSDDDLDPPSPLQDTAPDMDDDMPDPIPTAVHPPIPAGPPPFSFASFLHRSSANNVYTCIKGCEILHIPPGLRVCSKRPGGQLSHETLKTQAAKTSITVCEVYGVFATSTPQSVDDANDFIESIGNMSNSHFNF
jgi:hypothetical protein